MKVTLIPRACPLFFDNELTLWLRVWFSGRRKSWLTLLWFGPSGWAPGHRCELETSILGTTILLGDCLGNGKESDVEGLVDCSEVRAEGRDPPGDV